jgi:starch synthase
MDVLSVASEVFPLVKTGGLADVVGALPAALAPEGIRVRTLVPGYPAVLAKLGQAAVRHPVAGPFGREAHVVATQVQGLDLLVLDCPELYDRPGGPYLSPTGQDWPDNGFRFAALARIAADIGMGALPDWRPEIVHAHDWQAGLLPAYLHYRGADRPRSVITDQPRSVITVHNLAFPGKFPPTLLQALELPPRALSPDGVEFYGSISMLKAGLRFADRITTVSPGYAAEIVQEASGMGFDGLLRDRGAAVSGILNGIDMAEWNPATDPHLAARFTAGQWAARARNKAALQGLLGLDLDPDAPLFGVVSRLSWQKGLDLLLAALPELRAQGAQLALLGAGEPHLEQGFRAAAAADPGRIGCQIGYNETLAHQMQAGSDALLVPSRFEPCGLTQLYALRYGAIPVVARVGGLGDTVIDANPMALAAGVATGVQFAAPTEPSLRAAITRAADLYHDKPAWRRMQLNGMATDVSWRGPAHAYATLYRGLRA